MSSPQILLIEPFYGGSHQQLLSLITKEMGDHALFTLPAKKWHWRARTSALHFSQVIPTNHNYRVLFCSSVLNLAELVALRPDLGGLKKILYYHENQLVYPVRKHQERDFQYGYNQILSSLVADVVVFNSIYNQESFLSNIGSFLKLIPDQKLLHLDQQIRPKSQVLHFPLKFPIAVPRSNAADFHTNIPEENSLNIVAECLRSDINQTDKTHLQMDVLDSRASDLHNDVCEKELSDAEHLQCNDSETRKSFLQSDVSNTNLFDKLTAELHSDVSKMSSECKESLQNDTLKADFMKVQRTATILDAAELGTAGCHGDASLVKAITDETYEDTDGYDSRNTSQKNVTHPVTLHTKQICSTDMTDESVKPVHIVWPHRWEHDKDPETFFGILYRLCDERLKFNVSVMGEQYQEIPDIFTAAKEKLGDHILTWGYQDNKIDYYSVLQEADVVVSTAIHEFFGVAMLEAAHLGCYPLCPNRLVYPEIFPKGCLYNTTQQLYKRLREFCKHPHLARKSHIKNSLQLDRYSWETLGPKYKEIFYSEYTGVT